MMMPPDAHAKVSPSQLSRIIDCPGSFNYAIRFETKQSSYADEGSHLHLACERHINKYGLSLGKVPVNPHVVDPPLTVEQRNTAQDCIDYLAAVLNKMPHADLYVEQEVSLHAYHACLFDCWGTCDIILETDDELHVIDWKFGQGVPVYVRDNDQLYAYAVGSAKTIDGLQSFKKITIHCVQPRLDSFDSVELEPKDLIFWLESRIVPGLTQAYGPHAPFNPGKTQCRWCPAKERCRHRYNFQQQTASELFQAALKIPTNEVTYDEITKILLRADDLEQYITDLRQYIAHEIQTGKDVPDWKMVAGRATRQWLDPAVAENRLSHYLDTEQLYEVKLISPAKAEKIMRKKQFNEVMADEVIKVPGNPTLVPAHDKRPALTFRTATEIFSNIEEN